MMRSSPTLQQQTHKRRLRFVQLYPAFALSHRPTSGHRQKGSNLSLTLQSAKYSSDVSMMGGAEREQFGTTCTDETDLL